ncbi:MAG TPA: DNA alkylation repair protein [Polyangiaceae bacterium]
MATKKTKKSPAKVARATTDVRDAVAWLRKKGTKATRDGMARYAIPSDKAFGVSVGVMRAYAKKLGHDHELAQALWADGHYESRMLACFVADPALVTPAQMERWARDFDSWALCDTAAFHLFDRTPHAWKHVAAWAPRSEEFVRRAAFALLASLALHDRQAADAPFLSGLRLIERAAPDERNFVKKAVSWALRSVGRRNRALNDAAVAVAKRLAASAKPAARWVGKDALRELTSPAVRKRLEKQK